MSKNTIKDLLEQNDSEVREDTVEGIVSPVVIREIKQYAKAASGALQPSVTEFYSQIERLLNNYSLTIGDIDTSGLDKADTGEDDFAIFHVVTGDQVSNIHLKACYEKVQPQLYQYQDRPLNYRVQLDVEEYGEGETPDFNGDLLTGTDDDAELEEGKENTYIASYINHNAKIKAKSESEARKIAGKQFGTKEGLKYIKIKQIKESTNTIKDLLSEGIHEDGTDQLKRMDDKALKKALKAARGKDEKKYEKIVSEFESRGLKEDVDLEESHSNVRIVQALEKAIDSLETVEMRVKKDKPFSKFLDKTIEELEDWMLKYT